MNGTMLPAERPLHRSDWLASMGVWLLIIGQAAVPGFRFDLIDTENPPYHLTTLTILAANAMALAAVWRRRSYLSERLGDLNLWLLAYLAWLCLTAAWAPDPSSPIKLTIRMLGMGLVGLALCCSPRTHDQALAPIRNAFAAVMLGSMLVSLLLPQYALMPPGVTSVEGGEWRGITAHKNRLGQLAVFSAMLWAHAFVSRQGRAKRWALLWLVLSVVNILGTTSSTSLIAMLLGVTPIFILCRPGAQAVVRSPLPWLLGAGALVGLIYSVLLVMGIPTFEDLVAPVANAVGKDVTLTGRADIWAAMVPYIKENWVLGFGYGNFWDDGVGIRKYAGVTETWLPDEAHNGYLDVLNEGGIVALVLLVCFLVSFGRLGWRSLRYDMAGALYIAALINFVLTNISESGFLSPASVPVTMLMLFGTLSAVYCRRGPAPAPPSRS